MSANTKRLGQAILARRDELALNQQEVAASGGPSDTTLSKLENNLVEVVSNATLKKLDAGLRWVPGSARRVLHGDGVAISIEDAVINAPAGTVDVAFPPFSVSTEVETGGVPAWNTRKPEGMTEEQHKEIVRETEEYYRFRIQQAAKER